MPLWGGGEWGLEMGGWWWLQVTEAMAGYLGRVLFTEAAVEEGAGAAQQVLRLALDTLPQLLVQRLRLGQGVALGAAPVAPRALPLTPVLQRLLRPRQAWQLLQAGQRPFGLGTAHHNAAHDTCLLRPPALSRTTLPFFSLQLFPAMSLYAWGKTLPRERREWTAGPSLRRNCSIFALLMNLLH